MTHRGKECDWIQIKQINDDEDKGKESVQMAPSFLQHPSLKILNEAEVLNITVTQTQIGENIFLSH